MLNPIQYGLFLKHYSIGGAIMGYFDVDFQKAIYF